MKYIVGFSIALAVMLSMMIANEYILKYQIPEFLIGWISCSIFKYAKHSYEVRSK